MSDPDGPRLIRARARGAVTLTCALAGLLLAACGGSAHHTAALVPKGKVKSSLPQRAHVRFASDQPVATAVSSAHIGGKIIASIPFNPATDGFSFQNYGFVAGVEFDAHAMRELFGDGVCATAPSDACTLTPAAQQWAQQVAEEMAGGHCYGFSMTALRFFTHNLSPSAFGAADVYGLGLSPQLQDEIAADWATQTLSDVRQAVQLYQPAGIVAVLERNFAQGTGDRYTLGMYDGRSEGHAITPIGISDLGNGQYAILVYDNNYPGTTRAVYIDTRSETWRYQVQVNPSAPDAVWSGKGTYNPLDIVPVSTTEHTHPCPFCGSAGTVRGTDTISLGGNPVAHAHLLITTSSGKKLGFVGNRLVNQIKGAHVIHPSLNAIWKTSPEPIYQVPAGLKLTVTLSGGDPTGRDGAQINVTGPGFGATVDNLVPTSGSRTEVTLSPGGATLTVRQAGAGRSAPGLQLARDEGRRGNLVVVRPARLAQGSELSVGIQPTGRHVRVRSTGARTPVSISLHTVGPNGTQTLQKSNLPLPAGQATTPILTG